MTNAHDIIGHLKRRLLPMAIAFGVLCALVPPMLFGATSVQQMRARADLYTQGVARQINMDARRNPYIWPYRVNKIVAQTPSPTTQLETLSMRVTDCSGNILHEKRAAHAWPSSGHRVRVTAQHTHLATVQLNVSSPSLWRRIMLLSILSTLLGIALGSTLYTLPMRIIRRQSARLEETNSELKEAQHALELSNAQLTREVEQAVMDVRRLSTRQLNIQDHERARIARDLHDGLGQMISALVLEIERIPTSNPGARADAQALSGDILGELRTIINDLRPVILQQHGLVEVLQEASEQFELKHQLAVYFKHTGRSSCPPALAVALYRIYQESMSNIVKHAEATEISVHLDTAETSVTLTIRDDGCGFDPKAPTQGHGMINLRERVALHDGTFTCRVEDGEGTTIIASFTIDPQEDQDQPAHA